MVEFDRIDPSRTSRAKKSADELRVHRPQRKPAVPVEGGGDDFVMALAVPRRPVLPPTGKLASSEEVFAPEPGRKPTAPFQAAAKANSAADFAESARSAARIANVSFADVMAKAAQESNFDVNSRSGNSSAAGPFQFIEHTWLDMVKRHGSAYGLGREAAQIKMQNGVATVSDPVLRKQLLDLRKDVGLSSGMAARYLDEVGKELATALHRKPSETERRMAYFLGPGGAAKLIRAAAHNPDGSSTALLPQAAAANRNMFYGVSGALSNRQALNRISHFVSRHLKDFAVLGREERPVTTDRVVPLDPQVG